MKVNQKSSNITVDLEYLVVPELNHWWTILGSKITVPDFVVKTGIISDYVVLSVVFDVNEEGLIDITAIKVKEHDILSDVLETEGESGFLMSSITSRLRELQSYSYEDLDIPDYYDYV